MKITFFDINIEFINKAKQVFGNKYNGYDIEYLHGMIENHKKKSACYISPSN